MTAADDREVSPETSSSRRARSAPPRGRRRTRRRRAKTATCEEKGCGLVSAPMDDGEHTAVAVVVEDETDTQRVQGAEEQPTQEKAGGDKEGRLEENADVVAGNELDFDEDVEEEELAARMTVGSSKNGSHRAIKRRTDAEKQLGEDKASREVHRAKMREALERSKKESSSLSSSSAATASGGTAVVSPSEGTSRSAPSKSTEKKDFEELKEAGTAPADRSKKKFKTKEAGGVPVLPSTKMGGGWSFLRPVTDSLLYTSSSAGAKKSSSRQPSSKKESP